MSTDEKIELIQEKAQAKFEAQQAKQRLKYEKQIQKQQLKDAKKQMQEETKVKLQQQKQELKQQQVKVQTTVEDNTVNTKISPVNNVQKVDEKQIVDKNSKRIFQKIKSAKETPTSSEIQTVPSPVIMQQDLKPVPYIRTKQHYTETNYTINDY